MAEDLQEAIRLHALSKAPIAAYIDDRWFGPTRNQGSAVPYVTCQEISNTSFDSHQGHSGVEESRFQFTLWGPCQMKLIQLASYIDRSFDSFKGDMNGIKIGYTKKLNRTHLGKDPGQNLYQIALDYRFLYHVLPVEV